MADIKFEGVQRIFRQGGQEFVALQDIDLHVQDREFVAAIREGREPNSSVAQVLPCYRVLAQLEDQLGRTVAA